MAFKRSGNDGYKIPRLATTTFTSKLLRFISFQIETWYRLRSLGTTIEPQKETKRTQEWAPELVNVQAKRETGLRETGGKLRYSRRVSGRALSVGIRIVTSLCAGDCKLYKHTGCTLFTNFKAVALLEGGKIDLST